MECWRCGGWACGQTGRPTASCSRPAQVGVREQQRVCTSAAAVHKRHLPCRESAGRRARPDHLSLPLPCAAERDTVAAQAAFDAMPGDGVLQTRRHYNALVGAYSAAGDMQVGPASAAEEHCLPCTRGMPAGALTCLGRNKLMCHANHRCKLNPPAPLAPPGCCAAGRGCCLPAPAGGRLCARRLHLPEAAGICDALGGARG